MRPASPTNVAGVAHLRWPASRDVGFVALVLALSFAMLVVSGSRREVTVDAVHEVCYLTSSCFYERGSCERPERRGSFIIWMRCG